MAYQKRLLFAGSVRLQVQRSELVHEAVRSVCHLPSKLDVWRQRLR